VNLGQNLLVELHGFTSIYRTFFMTSEISSSIPQVDL